MTGESPLLLVNARLLFFFCGGLGGEGKGNGLGCIQNLVAMGEGCVRPPQQEMVGRRGKTRNEIREDKPELETLNRLEKQADREPQPSGAV